MEEVAGVYKPNGRSVAANPDLWPRNYQLGMWAWLLQRISGLAIVIFIFLHIWEITSAYRGGAAGFDAAMKALKTPAFVVGEWALFLAVVYHGINGIRLVLFDLGIGVRAHKSLFWAVLAISAVLIVGGSWTFLGKLLTG